MISFLICIAFTGKNIVRKILLPQAKPRISYDSTRKYISAYRRDIKSAYIKKRVNEDSVGRAFTHMMLEYIIPYWYGTTWDFNGYTAKPGEGAIACGYFVSTTLQHAGINVNRYKMAQKSSMDGALMLEPKDSLFTTHGSREKFLQEFQKKCKDGLYMVGLSFHVGFLYKQGSEVLFIHSSYLDPVCVVSEKAGESLALDQSKIFVVADITHNKTLMDKWISGDELKYK
jgi:hypothetical protein